MSQFFPNPFQPVTERHSRQADGGHGEVYGELPVDNRPVTLLGAVIDEKDEVKADLSSRFWFTYRKNFAPIGGKGPSSDQGWGCMLRAGQMMLAESLSRLRLGRNFKWPQGRVGEYDEIVALFHDTHQAPVSIQQIALTGAASEKRAIGEWFGPNTMAQVMRRICSDKALGLSVHVAMDSVVSKKDVRDEMSRSREAPVLLIIPLRLGLDTVNHVYIDAVKSFLSHKNCVGIMGGKPNQAHYFVGCQETNDSTWLLYLDPHTTQNYKLDEHFDETIHTSQMCWMRAERIDPSLAVGFLFDTHQAFDMWAESFAKVKNLPFGIIDSAQDRLVSITSTMVSNGDSDNSDYEVLDLA